MALIKKDFVSAHTYNSLPTIKEAANVPREYAEDLGYLQRLLAKHDVPASVGIRLIHRHYEIAEGEAMVFRNIELPAHGTVEVMRATPIEAAQLYGKNFFVGFAARLQAYEYTSETTVDLSEYKTFIAEFVEIVVRRKLQHKFGLKINHRSEAEVKTDRKEFEFPEEKCTITMPITFPLPEATHKIEIDTDWGALDNNNKRQRGKTKTQSTRTKCSHGDEDWGEECTQEDGIMFDGRVVQLGTPFHGLLNNLMEVW
ncbi:hypothetical protein V495_07295 [Pseudogymnoascus sp. VKM F-4514 (FW-929)]|nr:hypothetical protein V495_07295 [Pseudogymnoascus sp. VKM F-4514 (FW-929)]KFY51861.1 hypothetical protein V497_08798 [Pseudogymnoascus sp. VKM F-4516 (FW-969)]